MVTRGSVQVTHTICIETQVKPIAVSLSCYDKIIIQLQLFSTASLVILCKNCKNSEERENIVQTIIIVSDRITELIFYYVFRIILFSRNSMIFVEVQSV